MLVPLKTDFKNTIGFPFYRHYHICKIYNTFLIKWFSYKGLTQIRLLQRFSIKYYSNFATTFINPWKMFYGPSYIRTVCWNQINILRVILQSLILQTTQNGSYILGSFNTLSSFVQFLLMPCIQELKATKKG